VNEESLAAIARELQLHEAIRLGKGEVKTGGREKPRILACAVEALIGAVHQDAGYSAVERVVEMLFRTHIEQLRTSSLDYERDYKTRFQEWAHEQRSVSPVYELAGEFGPAHARCFRVVARLNGEIVGQGEGRSKKAAEQDAAQKALAHLLATSMVNNAKVEQAAESEERLESTANESQAQSSHFTTGAGSSGLTTSNTRKGTL
jgi:ribonuclease-3